VQGGQSSFDELARFVAYSAVLGREVSESEKMREGERKVRGEWRCERRLGMNGWIPLKPQSLRQ
jgi:hypothetical protein